MTYAQWIEEMKKGRGTELQKQKRILMDAAKKCSRETQDKLQTYLSNLDDLFAGPAGDVTDTEDLFFEQEDREPISELDYELISTYLGTEFADMMSRYDPPMELLSQPGAANALGYIFNTFGLLDHKYAVPDFKESDDRDAAVRKDLDTYAAQLMAMKDMKGEATLREILTAAVSIPKWKKDPVFKGAIKDQSLRLRLIQDEDPYIFLRDMPYAMNQYERDNAKTFKELGEDIAKIYRDKKIKYVQLEESMNVLRAVAGAKEADRTKWDNVKITRTEFRNKLAELRQAEAQQQKQPTPEEYQNELANSIIVSSDRITGYVHDIYNAKPVFHDEFDNPDMVNPGYRRKDFDAYMKDIDISGYSFGGKPLSDDEFGSLSYLSVIDPELSGGNLAVEGKSVKIENGDIDIALGMLMINTVNYGNDSKLINGISVQGPDSRLGNSMEWCIAPARNKADNALKAWQSGDPKPLAKIIAEGVTINVNDLRHIDESGKLNPDHFGRAKMVRGTLDLLKRDPALMQAAKDAGLKDETVKEMEGIIMATRIEKAGIEAKKRLTESVNGLRSMSSFEKEQCVTAMQRYDAMMKDIVEKRKAWEDSDEYEELSMKIVLGDQELIKKYGPDFKKNSKALEESYRNLYTTIHAQTKLMKRPDVYRILGAEGASGLDKLIPQNALDPKKAAEMNSVELAEALELAPKREIKTTAKELYDTLTKEYKAGGMNYAIYEARIKAMRELTGGDKNAKIDLKALDDSIDAKLNRSLGPLENEIDRMLKNEFYGIMGRRLSNIYKTYGSKPVADQTALDENAYTKEEFDQLESFTGNHLTIKGIGVNQMEFAALSVAATQAIPEIGATYLIPKEDRTGYENAIKDPTFEDAASVRAFYISDVDQGIKEHAREGIGKYFTAVTAPARRKVNEALKVYNGGSGSPAELGKIIGLGIKNIVNNTLVVDHGSSKMNVSNAIEGNILGRMAVFAERDPKLRSEVLKHATQEDLDKAKGMGVVYDIVRGAKEANDRLQASAEGKAALTDIERKACVELMLREKLLTVLGNKHAAEKVPDEMLEQMLTDYNSQDTKGAASALASMKTDASLQAKIGLPDYVKMLGVKGPVFARDLLDSVMPNREAFMKLSDEEILKAMQAKPGSKDDPFQNKEYTKQKYNEDQQLDKAMREYRARTAASNQKSL